MNKPYLVACALASAIFAAPLASAQSEPPIIPPLTQSTKVFGKPLSITETLKAPLTGIGVESEIKTQFIGKPHSLFHVFLHSPDLNHLSESSVDYYIGGVKVWTGTLEPTQNGYQYVGGVPPTRVPFNLIQYPIGPILVGIRGGIEFDGNLIARLEQNDLSIEASAEGGLGAAGFIEGTGSTGFVRAGFGGRVDLIDGHTGGHLSYSPESPNPSARFLGTVTLLRGSLYGFLDSRLFFGRYVRILKKDFFKWPGRCVSFGENACGNP